MKKAWELKTIAHIYTDFPTKFGVPRQSGLADTKGVIVFEPEYCSMDAVRELEQYSHLWLIWGFSECERKEWKATVRPPRLGGNKRVGVFATRSPFRPNPLGLSSVKLEKIEHIEGKGPVLYVSGVDMMNMTPIYDIKPYLPYVDCHPEARGGFAEEKKDYELEVICSDELLNIIPEEKRETLMQVLSQNIRPSYQKDENRVYGMEFAGMEIKFQVTEKQVVVREVLYEKNTDCKSVFVGICMVHYLWICILGR